MTTNLPITRCQYCGSEDLGEGWQHGEALVTFEYHGMLGNRLRYLICRRCGAVLYQCVAEPLSKSKVKTWQEGGFVLNPRPPFTSQSTDTGM